MDLNAGHIDQSVQVGRITFENRHQASLTLELIDSTLLEIAMASTPINRIKPIEVDLMLALTRNFDTKTRQAVNDGVAWLKKRKGTLTEVDVKGFVGEFEKRIAQYPPSVQKKIFTTVGAMYDIQRNALAKSVGIKANFKLIDTAAKRWMAKDSMHWIGSFYDDSVSVALREHVSNTMLTQGLGRADAAATFQKNLARDIRLGKLPALVGIPPPGWNSTPQAYFEGLTANAASRSTTWAGLESFREGGVEIYEVMAVMDERTSNICRTMNGKKFTVTSGIEQRDAFLQAKTPGEAKSIGGWQRAKDVQAKHGVAPGRQATPAQSQAMAAAGLAWPPYHYRCRTVIVSSGETIASFGAVPKSEIRTTQTAAERELISSPITGVNTAVHIGGGVNETTVYSMADGTSGVHKPISGEAAWMRNSLSIPDSGSVAVRERAAFIVDEALGFGRVPTTVMRKVEGKMGSYQRYAANASKPHSSLVRKVLKGDWERVSVLDYLTYNIDCHSGNWLIKNRRIVAIDNGYAFPVKNTRLNGNYTITRDRKFNQLSSTVRNAVRDMDLDLVTAQLQEAGMEDGAVQLFRQRYAKLVDNLDGESMSDFLNMRYIRPDGSPIKR